MSQTETPPEAHEILSQDDKALALVKSGMEQVAKGKMSLSDLFQSVVARPDPAAPDLAPPAPPKLTEEQKAALTRLPDVYGKVVVTAVRKLSHKEAAALVEEREIIDTLLGPLKKRKEESIREVLANHMDLVLTDEQKAQARRDRKGHYAPRTTQNEPVEGTGKKIQRSTSGGKPVLTIEHIEALHKDGRIDRPTYLKITKKPDMPRILDEDGLHRAIQKDPSLFFLLGSVAEPTTPTTSITVVPDK